MTQEEIEGSITNLNGSMIGLTVVLGNLMQKAASLGVSVVPELHGWAVKLEQQAAGLTAENKLGEAAKMNAAGQFLRQFLPRA